MQPDRETTERDAAAKPYEKAVYEAVRALLRHGHFARLEIGPGEIEGDITVGLHPGWSDGQFVVVSNEGKTEWAMDTCDGHTARELAAALTAYADWCDEDAEAFMARVAAEKEARARARAEASDDE